MCISIDMKIEKERKRESGAVRERGNHNMVRRPTHTRVELRYVHDRVLDALSRLTRNPAWQGVLHELSCLSTTKLTLGSLFVGHWDQVRIS